MLRTLQRSLILFFLIQVSFAQWTEQSSGVTTALYSVSAYDNITAWACGANGRVLRTTNGGVNWIITTSPNPALTLYNICAVEDTTALVTGSNADSTYIYKTTNFGNTWAVVFTQANGFVNAIDEISNPVYVFIGDPVPSPGGRWQVWVSVDEGSTWDSSGRAPLMQNGNEAGWNNAFFGSYNTMGWHGTNNTRIYHTFDGAQSWLIQPTPGLTNSYSVWFNNTDIGMTGGAILMKTTNSGMNWNQITAPGSGNILGITGENSEWFYVRGNSIYGSTNNGLSWILQLTAPAGTYQHISRARNGNYMWAVRNNGGITKGTGILTAIEPIGSFVSDAFNLEQNYPNPFNPKTNIKFHMPYDAYVKLTVFDALGREVDLLVSDQLKAGTYETDWDGSNYSSGVYFYKLEAVDYYETKKMILIK